MTEQQTPLWLRRTVLAGLLGGLLLAGFVVMQPFMAAIAWAAILSYVSWPLHLKVLAWLGPWLQERLTALSGDSDARAFARLTFINQMKTPCC